MSKKDQFDADKLARDFKQRVKAMLLKGEREAREREQREKRERSELDPEKVTA